MLFLRNIMLTQILEKKKKKKNKKVLIHIEETCQ